VKAGKCPPDNSTAFDQALCPNPGPGAFSRLGGLALTVQLKDEAPKQIIAGDTIEFYAAIPSDLEGWTGSARLTGPSQMDATSVATESGKFRVKFQGSSGTSALTAGQYLLTVWATSGNDRYTVYQAGITVKANLATGTPAQSHAQKMLSIIETAIYNRVNQSSGTASTTTEGGVESYSIDGVSVSKLSMADLQRLRNKYAAEVQVEQNGAAPIGRVKTVFTAAGTIPQLKRRYS